MSLLVLYQLPRVVGEGRSIGSAQVGTELGRMRNGGVAVSHPPEVLCQQQVRATRGTDESLLGGVSQVLGEGSMLQKQRARCGERRQHCENDHQAGADGEARSPHRGIFRASIQMFETSGVLPST